MQRERGHTIPGFAALLMLPAVVMLLGSPGKPIQQILPLILLLAPIAFLITFINTDLALMILIFSMLLSPEIKLAEVPQRAVVVRADDILLIVIFFSWLAKVATHKELGPLKSTPLNLPIGAYILIYLLANGIGILTGKVNALKSSFYILKYFEYLMLYFMVTNNIRDKRQVKVFIIALMITCALTCLYALATVGTYGRATAPFEGPSEPNTLGGYLVLLIAVAIGIFLYSAQAKWQFWCAGLACLGFVTLLQTLSRGSYVAFVAMYFVLVALTKRKKLMAVAGLFLAAFVVFAFLPTIVSGVAERIAFTFSEGRTYQPLGRDITIDASAAARVETWGDIFRLWKLRPLLGYGVTGVGFVDSQYPLVLGESGIFGLFIFIWLLVMILRSAIHSIRTAEDNWEQGLALGFLAGFVGILFHSFSAATFIIVRIMEPFWFLAAVVVMLPQIQEKQQGTS